MLAYQWQGMEETMRRLSALANLVGLDGEIESGAETIVTEAAIEPPERAGQRYRRSHTLSGLWKRSNARRTGRTVVVEVTNATPYGLFVQGEDQAEIHRPRWKKLRAIGNEQIGAIRARAQSWAIRTWRGG